MADLTTTGPTTNETSTSYAHGGGSHDFIAFERVSADVLLVHQSKMVGFFKKLREPIDQLDPVPRSAKDLLLKGRS